MERRPDVLAVVPARWASSRFPGKVLAPLAGRPVVLHVLERVARAAAVTRILVATDDERVVDAVSAAGFEARLTRPDHASGSDRIAEAATGDPAPVLLNVQGDEPLVDPASLDRLVGGLLDSEAEAATLAVPFTDTAAVDDPNVVKVVCALDGRALYFSRAVVPAAHPSTGGTGPWLRHVGVYAWRRPAFDAFTAHPPSPLELREGLEQLRHLEHGGRMHVEIVETALPGVDTPDDLVRCEALLAQSGPGV